MKNSGKALQTEIFRRWIRTMTFLRSTNPEH